MAEAHLQQFLISKSPRDRALTVQAVGEIGLQHMHPYVCLSYKMRIWMSGVPLSYAPENYTIATLARRHRKLIA